MKNKTKFLNIKTTLGSKLLLFYLLIVLTSILFMIFKGYNYIYEQVESEVEQRMIITSSKLIHSHFTLHSYTKEHIQNLTMHFQMTSELSDCRILVLYDDRDIIIDTGDINFSKKNYNGSLDFLSTTVTRNYTMEGYLSEPSLCITLPISKENYSNGYITFAKKNSDIKTEADYYYNILLMVYYLILALLGVVFLAIYIVAFIPLRKLQKGVKDFSIAKENAPIVIKSNDEYGDLANTLNVIGDELSKFDEYQRKFISNISHDFRSPLTSIQGYVQAMADGVIPPENQEKYLNIILFETERLTKLTSNLLDVNNFDKDNIFLDISTFDIHQSIQNTAASLEGTAGKKGVVFQLKLYKDEPLLVSGDKDKLQQVLHNLMDNAIKFSKDDATIEVSTTLRGRRVSVSVKDSGIGIPKDDQSKIFDRFYKTDLSRGKDKLGTGLGLSICKEIIAAHKQTINVISTEGVGSTFVFTVNKAKKDNK